MAAQTPCSHALQWPHHPGLAMPLRCHVPCPAGLFVDVENGTEVLQLAVRRDVADLSLAHRIYDNMRATQR